MMSKVLLTIPAQMISLYEILDETVKLYNDNNVL